MKKKKFLIFALFFLFIFFVYLNKSSAPREKNYLTESEESKAKQLEEFNNNNNEFLSATVGKTREISSTDYYLGSLDAPLKILIYSDFTCPFSASFASTTKEIIKEYGDSAVIAFRNLPLSSDSLAMIVAQSAECAGEKNLFWEMYDSLFFSQENNILSQDNLLTIAKDIGLDPVEFARCLHEERYKEKIYANIIEAKANDIFGTPTIIINDLILPGDYPMADFVDSAGIEREGLREIIKHEIIL